jgi:uncharacterized protein YjaZ
MKIEICNTFAILRESKHMDSVKKQTVWQERVISLFQPMMQVVPMDFSQMGACSTTTAPEVYQDSLDRFQERNILKRIQTALERAFLAFKEKGEFSFPETLQVGVFVSDRQNPIHEKLNHGFSGFGGIPGFIILILSPTEYVLKNIEALAVHEFHHNMRFLIEPWPQDRNISVGKYLLDEGLAEAFAASIYGEDSIGPHTIGLSEEALMRARDIILPHVGEKGFQNASQYMFGDAMAETCHYPKTGLPHGAGYAVGYSLVKEYFAKTGKSIFRATLESSEDILRQLGVDISKI